MQDAADELVDKMMMKYNKESVIVFNTLRHMLIGWIQNLFMKEAKN